MTTSQYFMHFSYNFSNFLPCPHMLEATFPSIGFISIQSMKASTETIHTSGKRHFPARKAIYE